MGRIPRHLDGPYVTYTTSSGDDVQVEIEPVDGFMPISKDRSLGRLGFGFRPAMEAAAAIVDEARAAHARPNEMTVRFGIKVTAGGVVIAKAADASHFEITMTWKAQTTQDG